MKIVDAKNQVLELIQRGIIEKSLPVLLNENSPDKDVGKFILDGKTARVIVPFNGFYTNISLSWFDGSLEKPKISGGDFFWYVFALKESGADTISHYFICDYHRLRKWVLDFGAPQGNDHKDHHDWRGSIEIARTVKGFIGHFRWGDEPIGENKESRIVKLNNIDELFSESVFISHPEEIEDPNLYLEGAVKKVSVNIYERDSTARKACIEHYGLDCMICGVNFEEIYGDVGKGYIHVHHIRPLSEVSEAYLVDPLKELIPVCPNCHSMLHKRKPPYGISEMKSILR